MEDLTKLTDEELDSKIDGSRANSYVPGSVYHKYIAEKQRREKLNKDTKEAHRFHSTTERLDKIIRLLELIGEKPLHAAFIAFTVAVIANALGTLLAQFISFIIKSVRF